MATYFNMLFPNLSVITCYANGTISAGDFVKAVANDDSVDGSTGKSSFTGNEVKVETCDANTDYPYVIGIASTDAVSGDLIGVYLQGVFIVRTSAAITAGSVLQKTEDTDPAEVAAIDSTYAEHVIGRALTSASAGDKYIIMKLVL